MNYLESMSSGGKEGNSISTTVGRRLNTNFRKSVDLTISVLDHETYKKIKYYPDLARPQITNFLQRNYKTIKFHNSLKNFKIALEKNKSVKKLEKAPFPEMDRKYRER